MLPIVTTEYSDTKISLFCGNLRSGTGTKNSDGTWTGLITVPAGVGFTATVLTRGECMDFLCRQILL